MLCVCVYVIDYVCVTVICEHLSFVQQLTKIFQMLWFMLCKGAQFSGFVQTTSPDQIFGTSRLHLDWFLIVWAAKNKMESDFGKSDQTTFGSGFKSDFYRFKIYLFVLRETVLDMRLSHNNIYHDLGEYSVLIGWRVPLNLKSRSLWKSLSSSSQTVCSLFQINVLQLLWK